MPGYGRSVKGVDQNDPFGYLADMIRGLLDELGIDTAHLVGNSYGGAAALRLALDTPHRVGKLVLMGPGGIGTTRGLPTAGLKSLLSYYGGDGPSRDKLETFIRTYLVYDGASVPDELIDLRYEASIDPEVVAEPAAATAVGADGAAHAVADGPHPRPPARRPCRPRRWCCGGATTRSTGPPADRCCCNTMPNAELVMTSHTGHWMQWERAELFNQLVTEFLSAGFELAHELTSVFGNVHLGYIVIETEKFADWRRFGRDAIGMHLDETLARRHAIPPRRQRVPVPAAARTGRGRHRPRLAARRPRRRSTRSSPASPGTACPSPREPPRKPRCAASNGWCGSPGPTGSRRRSSPAPVPATRRWTCGSAAASSPGNPAWDTSRSRRRSRIRCAATTTPCSTPGCRDYIDETISGVKLKIRFLRVNQRHHSVAIAAVNRLPINPIRTRVQHLNIQVADLDDMTASYQRVKELGFDMALAVGQHTNDKELSYYAMTPSGFEWEVGWNPIVVDENTWEPTTYQGISIWGHTPEGQTIIDKLAQFKTGAQSLLHREDSVPALAGAGIPDN